MTERGRSSLRRSVSTFQVGPSRLSWQDGRLVIEFEETALPWPPFRLWPRRLTGRIVLTPQSAGAEPVSLHESGRHFWQPVAPLARFELETDAPGVRRWQGDGYIDANWGDEPLEDGFSTWDWARGATPDGATILYDSRFRGGGERAFGLRFPNTGGVEHFAPPPRAPLGRGFWGVGRQTRCDASTTPRHLRTLEDSPFYTRSTIETTIAGQKLAMVHESYSGDRFSSPVVKAMLPFRMPRRAG